MNLLVPVSAVDVLSGLSECGAADFVSLFCVVVSCCTNQTKCDKENEHIDLAVFT